MFYRQKFVTNSSSTSIIAFGIQVDENTLDRIEEGIPEGIEQRWGPYDEVWLTIGYPSIGIDDDGLLILPAADAFQKKYKALKTWAERNGVAGRIGYIQESWYDG